MGAPPLDDDNSQFEAVLAYVKEARGFDFTGYKRNSLMRRVLHRMSQVSIEQYGDYLDLLQADAEEFGALFNTILINVTSFFRDADAWQHLRDKIVPELLNERGPQDIIRIWSAGCATGQEAYSLAMLFANILGVEKFRQRIKIYATDVDVDALAQARLASYLPDDVKDVPQEELEKYFELQSDDRYTFRSDLRRSVIFGRNDLVQDPPISRVDLLVCRNTMMYFTPETQAKILARFHFALTPHGTLFLGKAETLSHSHKFEAIDFKRRVFRRIPSNPTGPGKVTPFGQAGEAEGLNRLGELREHAFATSPVAQVVITTDGIVAVINQQAGILFGLARQDLGRPLHELEISYRPVELRGAVEQSQVERRTVRIKDVEWQRRPGESMWFEINVNPLANAGNDLLGVSIEFHDVSAARALLDKLEIANRELEGASEQLQSTKEELETTNEELQSTNEELQTTNEELQSTNEELQTTNEELETTNEELEAINRRLRERSTELDEQKAFLESILTSVKSGVAVVDAAMRVLVWNRDIEELWGLRRDEVLGEHLLSLDIGLPVTELRTRVRDALTNPEFEDVLLLDAINRRGRNIRIRVVVRAMRNPEGAILMMEAAGTPPD